MDEQQKARIDAAVRGEVNNKSNGYQRGAKGCLIVMILLIVAAVGGCMFLISGDHCADVDDAFIEQMNTNLGGYWAFGMADHLCYLQEDLQEYIGKGTISQGDVKLTYSFRAYIKDNTITFVKISVYDLLGNQIIDFYDIDAEEAYLDGLSRVSNESKESVKRVDANKSVDIEQAKKLAADKYIEDGQLSIDMADDFVEPYEGGLTREEAVKEINDILQGVKDGSAVSVIDENDSAYLIEIPAIVAGILYKVDKSTGETTYIDGLQDEYEPGMVDF